MSKTFRFHILGLVHLPVSEKYNSCAFTQKTVKLCKMLRSLGHEVILYGSEGSDTELADHFVQTHSMRDIRNAWGGGDNRSELGYNWQAEGFRHDFNTEKTKATKKFYKNAIRAINERKRDDDFLLVMQGSYHRPIADAANLWLTCEPGIGYRGSYTRFRAFESAYLMNFTYGSQHPFESINGHYYDRVIPNYFDLDDFPFVEKKDDYYFYIGRLIERKGVMTAVKTCEAIDAQLIVAGQGDMKIDSPNVMQVGHVGPFDRAAYMGSAKAVFVPTLYLEAFGGVNVEAQLCGTPVITTDFGCFVETVRQGVTGFRCSTLADFVSAAKGAEFLNPRTIRERAVLKYSMNIVKADFERWFRDLYQLYLSAHVEGELGWHHLS